MNNCDNNLPIVGKKEKTNRRKVLGDLQLNCFFIRMLGYTRGNRVVDNMDGTISLVSYSSLGADFCPTPFGKTEDISIVYYIKKCIQGQVYRQAQNDCKGIGNAANYYGAQKLQWCTTNDRSCEKLDGNGSYILDNTKSPAGISCAGETMLNKKWGIFSLSFIKEFGEVLKYMTDSPSSDSDYYWSLGEAGNGLIQKGSYDMDSENWQFKRQRFLMTATNYVLCGRRGQ